MSLAKLYFPVPWRNEYSCGWPYKKIIRISAFILNFWILWLQSRKYFLQLWYINVSMDPGTITGLRCFSLPFFNFYEPFLCFSVMRLRKWQKTWLQGFSEEEAMGQGSWMLHVASFKQNLFCFFLVWENFPQNMFLSETSWRNQLCRKIRTDCGENEVPLLEIKRLAWADNL